MPDAGQSEDGSKFQTTGRPKQSDMLELVRDFVVGKLGHGGAEAAGFGEEGGTANTAHGRGLPGGHLPQFEVLRGESQLAATFPPRPTIFTG